MCSSQLLATADLKAIESCTLPKKKKEGILSPKLHIDLPVTQQFDSIVSMLLFLQDPTAFSQESDNW